MLFDRDLDVIEACSLHSGVQRSQVTFQEPHRTMLEIAPAAFLRKAIDLIEKTRAKRIAHKSCLA